MAIEPLEAPSGIDGFLPVYDFLANYDVRIHASPAQVYRSLLSCDFSDVWIVRLLMTLRSGKRLPRNRASGDWRRRLQGSGFILLSEVPEQEIVLGIVGKFWRPDGGRRLDITPDGFASFSEHGFAKAAWNFKLREDGEMTVLSTETRIKCFGTSAWRKFRAYWICIAPFSGMIRKAILKQVKRQAEATA